MKKVFKSKIGILLVVPLLVVLVGTALLAIKDGKAWPALGIVSAVTALVASMFFYTDYTVESNTLLIRCGFIRYPKIDINSIRRIRETNNPLSAPAASLDRLELLYGKYDIMLVSPKEKTAFIQELRRINPNIEVVYRKK